MVDRSKWTRCVRAAPLPLHLEETPRDENDLSNVDAILNRDVKFESKEERQLREAGAVPSYFDDPVFADVVDDIETKIAGVVGVRVSN